MKNKIIIVCLLWVCINSSFAQSIVGISGGYTNAWPDYGNLQLPEGAQTNVKGYNISAFYYKRVSPIFQIGVEPGFVKRGAACIPGWQATLFGDSKVRLNYVELPLMVSGSYSIKQSRFDLYGKIGYGASLLLSGVLEIPNIDTQGKPQTNSIILTKGATSYNRLDQGLYSSLGLRYHLGGNSSLIIECDYYYGLKDFNRFNASKNRNLNFNIGFAHSFLGIQ